MGVWRKPPREVIDLFYECLPNDYGVEPRRMFGCPCAFVNGNLFTGVHQENIFMRLGEEDRKVILDLPGSCHFEPLVGRPMREYVVAPPKLMVDPGLLRQWMARSLSYAASLPPRTKKEKSARRKKSSGRS